jgi:uncharacterized protein YcbX
MTVTIASIYRYPVKGLSAQGLDSVTLEPGAGLPLDRRWAIAHGGARRLDPGAPEWKPKGFFLQLMSNEKLATLETTFDPDAAVLEIERNGRRIARGDLRDPAGRAVIEEFFAAYLDKQARGQPKVIEATDFDYSDTKDSFVSLINLASVTDVERVVGKPVEPGRFRGNLMIDGLDAWAENQWVGRRLRIGGAVLEVVERTGRCAAVDVEPGTGMRAGAMVQDLKNALGHSDCGVYASVIQGGTLSAGDEIVTVDAD